MRRCAARRAVAVGALVAAAGCGGSGEEEPDASAFEGTWDVSLVVGAADADPGVDPAALPGDATFRERWSFEDCDADSCQLRRPDGGLLLGDLDDVGFAYTEPSSLDQAPRFVGEGGAVAVARPAEQGEPAAGPVVADDQHCAGSPTRQWTVRIEIDVRDEVLSGTVLRPPEARQEVVDGLTCYGVDLTLGLSGVPAAAGDAQGGG